jgi:GNAT superfamily N-acetyltransferase
MPQYNYYDPNQRPSAAEREALVNFLHSHLEEYGDPAEDISKCIAYALKESDSFGGYIVSAQEGEQLLGVVVINKTGMKGYIPENILVYIATHRDARGKGVGKGLMNEAISRANGDVALHVEPENPARHLYEKLGFTNKYLEMRLQQSR